jgi:transcriptional regulator with XRE-family HTH domain
MGKRTAALLPASAELLARLGDRLRVARLRRRLSAKQVAERSGMAPMTLRSLERGSSGVTIGAYLAVMQVLGMEKDLDLVGKADQVGRDLQDAQLPAPAKSKRTGTPLSVKRPAARAMPQSVANSVPVDREIENSPEEQLRNLFLAMPAEQMRLALEALSEGRLRKALAGLPTAPSIEAVDGLDPSDTSVAEPLKPSSEARDWIRNGGFTSAEELAALIHPVTPLTKER